MAKIILPTKSKKKTKKKGTKKKTRKTKVAQLSGKAKQFHETRKTNARRESGGRIRINKDTGKFETVSFNNKKVKVNPIKERVKIMFSYGKTKITLPVTPESFELERAWNNIEVNINGYGTYLMRGHRQLYKTELSGFFPEHYNPTYCTESKSKLKKPEKYDQIFAKWQNDRKVIHFITKGTNTHINLKCIIDVYKSGMSQGGDVNYSMSLVEYRTPSKKRSKPSRKKRSNRKNTYTTKRGDTLSSIAKRKLGKSSKNKWLYTKNKKVLTKAFKRYEKKLSAKARRAYIRRSVYTRKLPKGIKLKLK